MKVYFTAATKGTNIYKDYYKEVVKTIGELGYKNLDETIIQENTEGHYKKLEKGGQNVYEDLYDKEISLLKGADINVFECSMPSLGIGSEVQKSLEFNKPTIVLYLENKIPHFLVGIKDEKLILTEIKDKKDLKKTLEKAFEEAKTRADKRFNFFISPKLLAYLEKISKEEGITKSKFIRNLILDHMRRTA